MKRVVKFSVLFLAVAAFAVSCGSPKPAKTIENLKAAISGETNASATYKAFSAKAVQEGYPNIAKMFAAASEAETIHVKNHNAVLVKLGEKAFNPAADAPKVTGMVENIQAAIEGETYEFTVMYPGFITVATTEKCNDALTSFTWAKDAEATHAKLYAQALNILQTTGSDNGVSSAWYTCPKCGDLFNTIEGVDNCPLCATKSTSFLTF
jgi:rubrerythrin